MLVIYLVINIGIANFPTYITVVIIIMLSLDKPASINFKIDTDSVAMNPIYNTKKNMQNKYNFN